LVFWDIYIIQDFSLWFYIFLVLHLILQRTKNYMLHKI